LNKRQRRDRTAQARRHARRLRLEDLHPKQQEGLTVGRGHTAKEALASSPDPARSDLSGEELVRHQLGGEQERMGRVPVFRAVLRDDTHSVWRENDGRLQRNVISTMNEDTFRAIQAGFICLRCFEPHEEAFPNQCDLCGYPMSERQIMDVAMEFRGREHLGPGQPIAEYLDQQDRRMEEMERAEAKASGRSPMRGLRQKILSPGAKRLRGVKDGDVRAA
jgi:hypothetical protein